MIIVRYGEIGLKGNLRKRFERILIKNIKNVLRVKGYNVKISTEWGRIYIHSSDDNIARIISGVFGVTSTSIAEETTSEMGDIIEKSVRTGLEIIEPGKSFAVRARRTGTHDFTSMDIQRLVGKELKRKTGSEVNLKNPDVIVYIEVRENKSFIYTSIFKGFGGLPVGSQERVLSVVNDEKSILSSWYAMRRGCEIDLLVSENFDEFREILLPWSGYREIEVIESEGDMKELLSEGFSMDYKGIYCSATIKEVEKIVSDSFLRRRKMPVYFPLMSLNNDDIERKIKIVRSYFR